VLIYLEPPLQKRLISVFHYALKPRGFLMLGSAETTGPQAAFTLIDKKWRVYRKSPLEAVVTYALPQQRLPDISSPQPIRLERPAQGRPVQDEVNRIILDRYGPAGVVVDGNLEIVHFRGHTGPYLEAASGEPNLNVLKMSRGGLLYPLRSALKMVRRRQRSVRKEGVLVQYEGEWRPINLEVMPVAAGQDDYYLILFEPQAPDPAGAIRGRTAAKRGRARGATPSDGRVADLRRELAASRDYLQSIIQELEAANEELQSANEEILSSNEELQSTNEELDTAKEELQSTNEELNTLNEELHSRNEELARVNSDLVNLLGSVDLPIVIVDDGLIIRRFTPAAERLFNLIGGDVGRSIAQINPNISPDELVHLIRATIQGVQPQEREVQSGEGRWYLLRIRPYKGTDNRLEGAVLTAVDIDDGKRYQRQLERSRDYFMKIVETVNQPLLVLDDTLHVQTANRIFYTTFKTTREETEGVSISELGHGGWDIPELRTMLADAATADTLRHLRIERDFQPAGGAGAALTAQSFELDDRTRWLLLAVELGDARQTN
jgi:two-component system CheB/CheR fusion protein